MAGELKANPKTSIVISALFGSVVRHALTAAGALLVAKGIVTPAESAAFISANTAVLLGLITYFAGQAWSLKKALR